MAALVVAVLTAASVAVVAASDGGGDSLGAEQYTEQASLVTLEDGSVLLRVEPKFRVHACAFDTAQPCSATLAPLPLRRLVWETGVDSAALRLTQGRWRDELWGTYPHGRLTPVLGAEIEATWRTRELNSTSLCASRDQGHGEQRQKHFHLLTHALAGIHCASLSTMGSEHTIVDEPLFTRARNAPGFTLRGVLHREALCTENLTPLQHLLPCGRVAGIAAMLDSHKLFKGSFQSLGWTITPNTHNEQPVFDIHIVVESVSTEHTRPASLVAEAAAPKRSSPLTLGAFFSTPTWKPARRCAAAASTSFVIDTRRTPDVFAINVEHRGFQLVSQEANHESLQRYTLDSNSLEAFLRVKLRWEPHQLQLLWLDRAAAAAGPEGNGKSSADTSSNLSSGVFVNKVHLGRGTFQGAISTRIHNRHTATPIKIRVTEVLPWQLNAFVSSRTAAITAETQRDSIGQGQQSAPFSNYNDTFVPARARHRPAVLTTVAVIPPATTLDLSICFSHGFLRSSDYPSDPFRGLEILPSLVVVEPVEGTECHQQQPRARIVSNALAIHMAVPDMSMPYNVIMLTSTAVAVLFSMLLTLASNLRLPKLKL